MNIPVGLPNQLLYHNSKLWCVQYRVDASQGWLPKIFKIFKISPKPRFLFYIIQNKYWNASKNTRKIVKLVYCPKFSFSSFVHFFSICSVFSLTKWPTFIFNHMSPFFTKCPAFSLTNCPAFSLTKCSHFL